MCRVSSPRQRAQGSHSTPSLFSTSGPKTFSSFTNPPTPPSAYGDSECSSFSAFGSHPNPNPNLKFYSWMKVIEIVKKVVKVFLRVRPE